jgi:LacI family transcriptional regulator
MITIKDVAVKAKTSIATVSAVVNDSAFVSKELKNRVESAIKELGFIPNALASSLKSKKSFQIGLLMSDIRNIFYPEFYRGFEDVVRRKRYNILLCNSDNDAELEKEYLQLLAEKRVDGIAITVSNESTIDEALNYYNNGMPFVFLELFPVDSSKQVFTHIRTDGIKGSKLAIQHLIDNGYKKIAIIAHYAQYRAYKERVDGYYEALKENNLEIRKEYIKIGGLSNKEAAIHTEELLKLSNPPDAIFATNNRMVLGVMKAVKSLNLKIPDDIALVGYDDFEWAEFLNPSLTTIIQPTYEIGREAAKELFRLIEKNKKIKPRTITLPLELIIRESSKKRV